MPRNAANKDVFRVVGGVTTKARFIGAVSGSRQSVNASCRITNDSFDTDLTLKFQSVPQGRDEIQQIVLTGTTLTGSFTISWDGYTTGAIAWNATAGTDDTTTNTFRYNIVTALNAMLASRGLPTGSIKVTVTSHTANGSTIKLWFNGALGNRMWATTTTARTVSAGGVGTTLTGGSPAAAITVPTGGYAPGQGPASDITPDGKSSATITVKPRGSIAVAFGTDSDSNNELGPDFWVVGLTGNGLIEMEHDASAIHFLGGNA